MSRSISADFEFYDILNIKIRVIDMVNPATV